MSLAPTAGRSLFLFLSAALADPASPVPGGAPPVSPVAEALDDAPARSPVPVPFGPGESARYQVKLGALSVGEGSLSVLGIENVRGVPAYHLDLVIRGGIPLARVDDRQQSWLGVEDLVARRFIQDIHEVRYKRYRHFEFHPENLLWTRADAEERGPLASSQPLDDLSFVYYIRTLPLREGDVYTMDRYYRESGNPVVVRVLRRDRVTVPAGTFNTVVVSPRIRTRGLFSEGGEAELHFTDDDRRILVLLRSKVPLVGSLTLHLREWTAGIPLRPFRAGEALPPAPIPPARPR